MTSLPLLGFALGAVAAFASMLALVPFRPDLVRTGARSKVLSVALLLTPLAALVLVADGNDSQPDYSASGSYALQLPPEGSVESDDWALMAHAYLGGPPPTAGATAAAGTSTGNARTIAELLQATSREPENAQAWLALAGAQRRARDFPAAVAAYQQALELEPDDADAWADYADAMGSSANWRLQGRPAEAIARALRIDPRHSKALWLQATLDLELRHYADALSRWQQLRAVLPAGSPDITIVDANIAEARQLVADAAPRG